jgi:HEAT repeat protein
VIFLDKGLIKFNWNDIDNLSDSEITYFLSLEGKTIPAICKIRGLNREEVQKQIIEGKIKYRFLAKSKDEKALFETLCNAGKTDKLAVLSSLSDDNKEKIITYIKTEFANMTSKNKEYALWTIGELKALKLLDIPVKSIVHKHVNIRRMAVSALGKIGDKASETALIRALDDENMQVVLYAIKALKKIKSNKAIIKIKGIYEGNNKDYLLRAAKEYLEEIGEK